MEKIKKMTQWFLNKFRNTKVVDLGQLHELNKKGIEVFF